jgi:hypothetical protein
MSDRTLGTVGQQPYEAYGVTIGSVIGLVGCRCKAI